MTSVELAGITRRIQNSVDLAAALREASAAVCDVFGAERLTVYALDPDAQRITSIVQTGLNSFKNLNLPMSLQSIAGYCALECKVLNIRDAYDTAELAAYQPPINFLSQVDQRTGFRTRQVLAAPVFDEMGALGVVQLINCRSGERFAPALESLAVQFASALAAPLRARIEREREATAVPERYRALVDTGALSEAELKLAVQAAGKKAVDLETVLTTEFHLTAGMIGAALSRHFGVSYAPFRAGLVRPDDLLRNLRREYCEANEWLPVDDTDGGITVLATDPAKVIASRIAQNVFPRARIEYRVTTRQEFRQTLHQFYGSGAVDTGGIGDLLGAALDDDAAPKPSPELPGPVSDLVYFSATAPHRVARGKPFLLGIWAHLEKQRAEVLKQVQEELQYQVFRIKTRGPAPVARGTLLGVRVSIPDFNFDEHDAILWAGQVGNCSFAIDVPAEALPGRHIGTARLMLDGLAVSRLHFDIDVGDERAGENTDGLMVREERPHSAFASYASENRDEVLSRIQGMQKLLPDLDIFLDIASLRSGDDWASKLEAEIARRDVFYLFWSSAARESKWVEAEWRAALKLKGLGRIDPVPLEPPDKAPPPAELSSLHFNEWTLAYRKS